MFDLYHSIQLSNVVLTGVSCVALRKNETV